MGIEPNILSNKKRHIEITLDESTVKSSGFTYLEDIYLKHAALSELNFSEIETGTKLFNYDISMPVFISSMTGGSREGNKLNKSLVKIANKLKIPIGLGSFKLLFKYPEYIKDFKLKNLAADIPLFSNIGAVQIKEFGASKIIEMSKLLEVDAQIIHLNSGQELMNVSGDRNFSGIKKSISEFCSKSSLPVIVKETGFGISPLDLQELLNLGVSYVDIAGSGGTNWVLIEGVKENLKNIASSFASWGIPSSLTLLSLNADIKSKVFASGGFKSGIDIVKGLALGAEMVGIASHCLRIFYSEGEDAMFKLFEDYKYTLKMAMLMTESKNLPELRKNKYILSAKLAKDLIQFKEAYETK